MSTYTNPSNYKSIIDSYFTQVRQGSPSSDLSKAGVGVGIYYDGRNGYEKHWTAESARSFVKVIIMIIIVIVVKAMRTDPLHTSAASPPQYVAEQGGMGIDVFRLLKDRKDDWPHDDYWYTILAEFANGTLTAPTPAPAPTPGT
jgi:hypothetical protein